MYRHVSADVYLSEGRDPGKVYSELYTDVAVMFASMPNYMDFYTEAELHEGGVTCLMILNEIVSAFDEVSAENVTHRLRDTSLESLAVSDK